MAPKLRPRYTARMEVYGVEDNLPESEIGILYPDVEVMRVKKRGEAVATVASSFTPASSASVIELDLLRRGTRSFAHPRLPDVPYAIALTRSQSGVMDVWPLGLQDCLPIIPVPLRSPDPDIPLELPQVMADIYD